MTLRTCIERTIFDREAWLETLNLTEAEFDNLVAARVLRQQPGSAAYRLEFVGVAMTSRGSIAVAPRVPGVATTYSFGSILRLLRRYFLRSAARAAYESAALDLHFKDDRVVREFDAYLALLSWYWDHGLYRQEARTLTTAGGRPDWPRTFARSPVLISDGAVLYARPTGSRRAYSPSIVGSLQLHFLRELSNQFGFAPPPDIETEAQWSLPLVADPSTPAGAQLLTSRLQAERRSVFRGDRLVLLDTLLALLGVAGLDGQKGLRLYGTTAFYMVWEDACRHYFSSSEYPEIPELAQPQWRLLGADGSWSSEPGGQQRPDIAMRAGDIRALLDAKYYYPFPAARPGWADIVKQIYYEESLPVQEGEVVNCFLMPGPAVGRFNYVGYVDLEGAGTKAFPAVEAWLLNSLHVLDSYASGDTLQPPILGEFLRHRERMIELLGKAPANVSL